MPVINYSCPKHQEVILFSDFVEADSKPLFVMLEEPKECPKCEIHYYKEDCKKITEDDKTER